MSSSSSSKVSIDEMADAIMENLQDYADLAADEMKDAVKDAAKTVRKEIMANAPRKSGDYAKSWATKKQYETSESISYVVYSKNRYQLAHLLENGHALRTGGRTRAFPHIAPAEETGYEQLESDLKKGLS